MRAGAICGFAREARINLLVVGKPTRPGYFNRFIPSIVHKLLDRGRDFDLVVIDTSVPNPTLSEAVVGGSEGSMEQPRGMCHVRCSWRTPRDLLR